MAQGTSVRALRQARRRHRRARAPAARRAPRALAGQRRPRGRVVDQARLRELEPNVRGVRALHSPATGIVDFGRVASAYARDVVSLGGAIRTRTAVAAIRSSRDDADVKTATGTARARIVITCCGLHSDRPARMTGAPASPRIVPFRGRYHVLRRPPVHSYAGSSIRCPIPPFPFLGAHFTRQIGGEVSAGPNAVPAFAREGYRFRDVRARDA